MAQAVRGSRGDQGLHADFTRTRTARRPRREGSSGAGRGGASGLGSGPRAPPGGRAAPKLCGAMLRAPPVGPCGRCAPLLGAGSPCLERRPGPTWPGPTWPFLPLLPGHWVPSLGLRWARGVSHLARLWLVPLEGLVGPRCLGRVPPKTARCPRPWAPACPVSGCLSFFSRLCLSASVSVPYHLAVSVCLSLCSSGRLCPCASVSASLRGCLSLYISLPSASLLTDAGLCLHLYPPPPLGSSPGLRLAAPGGLQHCGQPAWGQLRALPGVHFAITSACPSPRRGLRPPSAAAGRGGGARHPLGSPGAPDPLCSY